MGFSLIILAFGSLFSGYFFKDSFVGFGSTFWGNSIFILSKNNIHLDCEFIPLFFKNLPLILSVFFIIFALLFNFFFFKLNKKNKGVLTVLNITTPVFYQNPLFYSLIKVI
jgi:hypothetical protein